MLVAMKLAAAITPGTYRVTVKMGDDEESTALNVLPDPLLTADSASATSERN